MPVRINTGFLVRCIDALESAFERLQLAEVGDATYDIFRAASVKEFEIVLEQSGNLLKRRLRPYFASNRQADRLTFGSVFRHAARHGLISVEACERWLIYRESRNVEHGEDFAEATLELLPSLIEDARALAGAIAEGDGGADRLDLPFRYREMLEALLREHVPDVEVWAYGSRINGESHEASDLDLVLRSLTTEPLGARLSSLREAFDRSTIPILIQAHDWAQLPDSFRAEIQRDYVVVQKGAGPPS